MKNSIGSKYRSNNDCFHREDGPAIIHPTGKQFWYVRGIRCYDNKSYQRAACITDEEMLTIVLKYGNVE